MKHLWVFSLLLLAGCGKRQAAEYIEEVTEAVESPEVQPELVMAGTGEMQYSLEEGRARAKEELDAGMFSDAAQTLRMTTAETEEEKQRLLVSRGWVDFKSGRIKPAEQAFLKVAENNQAASATRIQSLNNLSLLYYSIGEVDKAEAFAERAANLSDDAYTRQNIMKIQRSQRILTEQQQLPNQYRRGTDSTKSGGNPDG